MTLRPIIVASLLLAACSTSSNDQSGRRPIGKADLVGSCSADECGGASVEGNCWCDDECLTFGDCCADKATVCDGAQPTIDAGEDSQAAIDAGESEPEPQHCGGIAGIPCSNPGQYCMWTPQQACGMGDQPGICVDKPEVCTEEIDAVCACGGTTYSNACKAALDGKSVNSQGECPVWVRSCGGLIPPCPTGETCVENPEWPAEPGCDPWVPGCHGMCAPI
jgi:hypothetical protein